MDSINLLFIFNITYKYKSRNLLPLLPPFYTHISKYVNTINISIFIFYLSHYFSFFLSLLLYLSWPLPPFLSLFFFKQKISPNYIWKAIDDSHNNYPKQWQEKCASFEFFVSVVKLLFFNIGEKKWIMPSKVLTYDDKCNNMD